jgi:lysophospholipase L1-like esterase
LVLFVGGELFARFYLGLGDPPLSMNDPQIEYLFKPDQDCRRFGRRIKFNHYSMRSDDFPAKKTDPRELRVMMLGDSVINGGALTDQAKLATSMLQERLAADLGRPVVVGNISAGSWGPPNELAYLKRFGLFDADVVVLVLSSHDAFDVPTFQPIVGVNPGWPDRRPVLALWDGFERYLLPRLKWGTQPASVSGDAPPAPSVGPSMQSDVDQCLAAVRETVRLCRAGGARVIVAQHLERDETLATPLFGYAQIAVTANDLGVTRVDLGPAFAAARAKGEDPYRDAIHPNEVGQRVMAEVLLPVIEKEVSRRKQGS